MIGLEGLIVFQGAESPQVRNALRAAKRPMRNGHIHSSTHTCKGHRKDMDGRMRKVPQWGSHTYALTCHRVAVCSCLLWENAGGLSLEAGTGSHPQQPPDIPGKPAEAEGPSSSSASPPATFGSTDFFWPGEGRAYCPREANKRICPGLGPCHQEAGGSWFCARCRGDTVNLIMCVLGPAALL